MTKTQQAAERFLDCFGSRIVEDDDPVEDGLCHQCGRECHYETTFENGEPIEPPIYWLLCQACRGIEEPHQDLFGDHCD